ncbi:type I-E CRISPR-associated protein Cse1/CasA [Streptomyces sp. NPDC102384]|uniref:type I-E CRISPR-associated protein Cse1/CasA n=1 Tax=unclassified Streptomyces TaxID=2593676 RepID=UPI003818394B
MPDPSYPLDDRDWIPVRHGTTYEATGLRGLFLGAHCIDDLAVPLPPARSVVLRMLTAITARLTGLDDPDLDAQQWHEHRARLLARSEGFDPSAVHAYFDQHAFDLLDPQRPFLQDPTLARQSPRRRGIDSLIYGRPAGRNLAWFNAPTPQRPLHAPVPCEEAVWHLLIHHFYGPSGGCATRTITTDTGTVSNFKAKAGPLRASLSFHPHGRTLYETLLAHLVPLGEEDTSIPDACPWELPTPPDPLAAPAPATWPGRLLTGRSPHAVLLVPDPTGRHIVDAHLTWAHPHPVLEATDPYLIHDLNPTRDAARRRTPRRASTTRALWRDLDALLLAEADPEAARRPRAFTHLNDLPEPTRSQLRVRTAGFVQDGQTIDHDWYTALTPPIWTDAQENDPARAARIAACRTAAEHLGQHLEQAADQAWKAVTGSKKNSLWTRDALAAYWPRAEATFHSLLDTDEAAHPRFAADAIAALYTASTATLAHTPRRESALARAIAQLRRAARPPQPRTPRNRHAQP